MVDCLAIHNQIQLSQTEFNGLSWADLNRSCWTTEGNFMTCYNKLENSYRSRKSNDI